MTTHDESASTAGDPPLFKGRRFALWREGREDPVRPGVMAVAGDDCLVDLRTGQEAELEEVARYIVELEARLGSSAGANQETWRRFYIVWSVLGVVDLLALLPLFVVPDRLVYSIMWGGISTIAWSIMLLGQARLANRISATRARVLAPIIAVVMGYVTALAAILARK